MNFYINHLFTMRKSALSIVFLLLFSCNPIAVKNVTELASLGLKVVSLLKGCTELCEMFSDKVAKVNQGMVSGIKSDRSALELGKYWEKYWGEIHSDYRGLQVKLLETNRVSQEYFSELEKNNQLISNQELKADDLKKTVELKKVYEKEYNLAVESLNKAQKVLKEGDDIMLILRNNVLRSSLQSQISVLKNIKDESDRLAINIKSFSSTCIPLFTQNQ